MATAIVDPDRWATDGTGALSLRMARSIEQAEQLSNSEKHLVTSFHPRFVYPLFGKEETIYGYEDLDVQLAFNSSTLKNYLSINYKSKLPDSSPIKPDDIEGTFYKFIPPDYSKSIKEFEQELESETSKNFKPPGQKISSYRSSPDQKGKLKSTHFLDSDQWVKCHDQKDEEESDVIFELWGANWKTPGFKDYHRRMQILVLLYIEGGSYIEEDDDRWEFVVLFEKRKLKSVEGNQYSYHFCGYVSLYSFYHYPSLIRLRLSQFIILPPYQSAGHGSMLYSEIFQYLLKREDVAELTIEDPSESFEDLRDKCDLKMLMKNKVLDTDLNKLVPLDKNWYQETKAKWKLADRQFRRLIEMGLRWKFSNLEKPIAKIERLYRIGIKERLYRLVNISKEERRERLQATFESVLDDYDRLLRGERIEID
ncbi:acyl-CoA N-acyltransferase [Phakopsora pachyrhizi]|uniref:Histone acetyltransferase type B catalytic subunit n=1 Tax=Phakopsora pachyrhizi TaxID=170000 RepID=A0AAV0APC7_PHAPC|nr:acyl-CoA N-acyltransferase [Phakopsora pachyrhizi]